MVVARVRTPEWSSLAAGDRHRPLRAAGGLAHAPLHPVRLRQLDQGLGRELGRVGLHLVDQCLERTAVAHDVEHLVGADGAADAPEVQLDAGLGVGVVAQEIERGLEVADGLRELQVAAAAEPGPAVELGVLLGALRDGERGLVVARRLVPFAACQRVVAGGAHGLERLGIGDRVTGDEVVGDRSRLAQDGGRFAVEVLPHRGRRTVVHGVRVDRVAEREQGAVVDEHAGLDRGVDRDRVGATQRHDSSSVRVGSQDRNREHDLRRVRWRARRASRSPRRRSGVSARARAAWAWPDGPARAPRRGADCRRSPTRGRGPARWARWAHARVRAPLLRAA